MIVFFDKSNENTYPKGRALMQMYRVVPLCVDMEGTSRINGICPHGTRSIKK